MYIIYKNIIKKITHNNYKHSFINKNTVLIGLTNTFQFIVKQTKNCSWCFRNRVPVLNLKNKVKFRALCLQR